MITSKLLKIRESGFSVRILNFLIRLRLDSFVMRLIHARDINASTVFFTKNAERLSAVSEIFADEASRDIYLSAIRFRQGFRRKDVPTVSSEQYFPNNIIKLSKNETFIDCGAFTGDTLKIFLEKSDDTYHQIVCFEPDQSNFSALDAAFTDERIVKIQAGVWNEATTLKFLSEKGEGSHVSDSTKTTVNIPVVAIDDIEACQEATYIKMDIEGAEMNALLGAKKTIEKNRPKLAICIYHSNEDMLNIPEYLHASLTDYSFYVRHHSINWQDTVLYAIPN